MHEEAASSKRWEPPRWAIRLMLVGAAVVLISTTVILLLPKTEAAEPSRAVALGLPLAFPSPTPARAAVIQRQVVAATTPLATPTFLPSTTPIPPPLIDWSDADKNILSWVCYGEIGGMAEKKIDACLSVISTIRARYAYNSPFKERDIVSTLERTGQFTGLKWTADRPGPDPDLMWAVNQYQAGARGSCSGYLYFDSLPGGPVLCSIHSSNNEFMDFHNGWN
jgi:hypothetical protein